VPSTRPFSFGMSLQQQEIGLEARPPRRPGSRVGQGARKVPRPFPLIFRISNRGDFSVVPCFSPVSAAAGITRHRRAKPTRVVVQRGRRFSLFRCSEVRITRNEVFRPRSRLGGSMLREQGVEHGSYHGRKLEATNSNPNSLGVVLRLQLLCSVFSAQAALVLARPYASNSSTHRSGNGPPL
jgi:hypothetical protein